MEDLKHLIHKSIVPCRYVIGHRLPVKREDGPADSAVGEAAEVFGAGTRGINRERGARNGIVCSAVGYGGLDGDHIERFGIDALAAPLAEVERRRLAAG